MILNIFGPMAGRTQKMWIYTNIKTYMFIDIYIYFYIHTYTKGIPSARHVENMHAPAQGHNRHELPLSYPMRSWLRAL